MRCILGRLTTFPPGHPDKPRLSFVVPGGMRELQIAAAKAARAARGNDIEENYLLDDNGELIVLERDVALVFGRVTGVFDAKRP